MISSVGSYDVTAFNADRSSSALVAIGWPISRLLPWPMISSGCSLANAARTTCSTSLASRTFKVSTRACSKPREVGESELAAMYVHAAEFGAAMQGWKHLAGIEQALRVEGAFQPLLLVEIDLAEHLRHQVALLDADAVFAGEDAAKFDADPKDVRAEGLCPLHLAGLVGIVQDQRMQIAVAGMKHIGDAQIILFRKLADARQCVRQG